MFTLSRYRALRFLPLCGVFLLAGLAHGQALLDADGPGNTYELINSILAPSGGDVVEHPECIHPEFGRHIGEVWDTDLGRYVFEFYAHVKPDNDRCINVDRQRVEIKTYDVSPDSLKGVVGESVTYRWKFRLAEGFQPSTSFTHLHQIKAVGGNDADPIFTITARKASPNRIELKHDNTTVVATAPLSSFLGVWVECTEQMTVGAAGTYSMTIKRVGDGATLLSYANGSILTIRADNSFIRPKWGIYRSLLDSASLRDDSVRFASFFIKESSGTVSVPALDGKGTGNGDVPQAYDLQAYPNPFNPTTMVVFNVGSSGHALVEAYDAAGRRLATIFDGNADAGHRYRIPFDGGALASGAYVMRLSSEGVIRTQRIVLLR